MSLRAGHANPRIRQMIGWQRDVMKLRLLARALYGVNRARMRRGYSGMFPWTVQVQTSTECNSSCRICPHRLVKLRLPQGQMDPALFRRIADECMARPELLGFGLALQNEPLADPRIHDFVRELAARREHETVIFLASNGIELTPESFTRLERAGLDFLQVSINAYSREEYERLSPGRSWEALQRNLDALLGRDLSRVGLHLSFVRTKSNHAEVERAVRHWRARGVHTYVHHLSNRAGTLDNYKEYYIEESALPVGQRLFRRLVKLVLPACPYVFFQASILFNGDVLICTHDYERQVILGNVGEESLYAIWNGERANRVRRAWLRGRQRNLASCHDCTVYHDLAFT